MSIYQMYEIDVNHVTIKFYDTVNIATLINANFQVFNNTTATPVSIVNPFQTIDLSRDYYSTSRTLMLYWNPVLAENVTYSLVISHLKTISGILLPVETISFNTIGVDLDPLEDLGTPTREPVTVEDYSIKNIVDSIIPAGSVATKFYVTSIVPAIEDAAFLSPSFNEGRIEVNFNLAPAANFISGLFFKIQKKQVVRGLSNWVDVAALITSDDTLVLVYMPSVPAITDVDQTSYFGVPNLTYWEAGFKYRLKISPQIGPAI